MQPIKSVLAFILVLSSVSANIHSEQYYREHGGNPFDDVTVNSQYGINHQNGHRASKSQHDTGSFGGQAGMSAISNDQSGSYDPWDPSAFSGSNDPFADQHNHFDNQNDDYQTSDPTNYDFQSQGEPFGDFNHQTNEWDQQPSGRDRSYSQSSYDNGDYSGSFEDQQVPQANSGGFMSKLKTATIGALGGAAAAAARNPRAAMHHLSRGANMARDKYSNWRQNRRAYTPQSPYHDQQNFVTDQSYQEGSTEHVAGPPAYDMGTYDGSYENSDTMQIMQDYQERGIPETDDFSQYQQPTGQGHVMHSPPMSNHEAQVLGANANAYNLPPPLPIKPSLDQFGSLSSPNSPSQQQSEQQYGQSQGPPQIPPKPSFNQLQTMSGPPLPQGPEYDQQSISLDPQSMDVNNELPPMPSYVPLTPPELAQQQQSAIDPSVGAQLQQQQIQSPSQQSQMQDQFPTASPGMLGKFRSFVSAPFNRGGAQRAPMMQSGQQGSTAAPIDPSVAQQMPPSGQLPPQPISLPEQNLAAVSAPAVADGQPIGMPPLPQSPQQQSSAPVMNGAQQQGMPQAAPGTVTAPASGGRFAQMGQKFSSFGSRFNPFNRGQPAQQQQVAMPAGATGTPMASSPQQQGPMPPAGTAPAPASRFGAFGRMFGGAGAAPTASRFGLGGWGLKAPAAGSAPGTAAPPSAGFFSKFLGRSPTAAPPATTGTTGAAPASRWKLPSIPFGKKKV